MNEFKKKFGLRLRELRKNRGLTQEQLAELIEIGLSNISYIENGKTYPSVCTVEKICKVLEIEPYDLYNFTIGKDKVDKRKKIIEHLSKNDELLDIMYKIFLTLK